MSGPKKDMMKLSEQGVVTEEALIAYLQNKLSPDEVQQLEKLLQDDPFAQDALEGLKSSMNQAAVAASITSLNKKVRERTGLKERKKMQVHWVTYVWIAVVFLVLIGIGFVVINFLNKKDSTPPAPEKKEIITAPVIQPKDTAAISQKPDSIAIDTSMKKVPLADTVKAKAVPPIPQGNTDTKKPDIKNGSANVTTGKTAPTGAKAPETIAPKKTKADSIKTNSPVKAATPAKTDIKDPVALQNEAMNSFNSGDYNTAGADFDQLLKHDPNNVDALYFGGISDYINGKTGKSESNFDKLLKSGNKYMDGSKWYKANILIKKGHSEAAKPLLQEISNSNSPYKERALKKLADLGLL